MKISKVTMFEKCLPLKEPFEHATSGKISALEEIFIKLETDDGHTGYGEVRGNCMYFTGDCTKSVEAVLQHVILPKLPGMDPCNIHQIMDVVNKVIVGNTAAKAAVDIAVHDLAARIKGIPVYELLGGMRHQTLATEENIPFCPVEETIRRTKQIAGNGCKFIKVRVGLKSFSKDIDRLKAIAKTLEEMQLTDVELAIDANQAWTVKEAIERIECLYPYGVRIVEQPVAAKDIVGLKYVKDHTKVKIFADEAVFTPEDMMAAIRAEAIDGVHIKLIKSGGIANAMKMVTLAEANHMTYMIGGMDEGMMAVAAAVQCAAAANANYHELDGHRRIAEDVTSGLVVENAVVQVPDGPGLGVKLDESKLTKICEISL